MLQKCKLYEVVDCPKDQKVIQNWWVFDIKLDGQKKAHLVAKASSKSRDPISTRSFHQLCILKQSSLCLD